MTVHGLSGSAGFPAPRTGRRRKPPGRRRSVLITATVPKAARLQPLLLLAPPCTDEPPLDPAWSRCRQLAEIEERGHAAAAAVAAWENG
mmetsp:Transcript_48958/g.91781  ORF Transcript_48958/g.91781 Transcript_48958/m.91781 type:complete len:89 (-) Transcript_48958:48-314(-)